MGVLAGSIPPVTVLLETVYVTSKLLSEHKTPILSTTIVASGSAQKIKSILKLSTE